MQIETLAFSAPIRDNRKDETDNSTATGTAARQLPAEEATIVASILPTDVTATLMSFLLNQH
jgi:hypothetical protein